MEPGLEYGVFCKSHLVLTGGNIMRLINVLFICRHNSGRSQIAEAYLRKFGGDRFHVESAGYEPAEHVNPLVVEVMKEEGIDLSDKKPQSVFELFKQGQLFEHVITVCSDSEGECPIFPGITRRWHTPFPDPAAAEGTHDQKLARVREIRDAIKAVIINPPEKEFDFRKLP
jgi:arsenate reductase